MKKAYIKRNEASGFDVSVADWFFLRLRGLIGRNPEEFGPLLIIPCSDIHTFFMSAAIDVIYVNKHGTILKVDPAVAPRKICPPVKGCKYVVELPAGKADELKIKESETWEVIYK